MTVLASKGWPNVIARFVGLSSDGKQVCIMPAQCDDGSKAAAFLNHFDRKRFVDSIALIFLVPNPTIAKFGLGRFDQMIREFSEGHLEVRGTRSELLQSGVASAYMFQQMGQQKSRIGGTEYGDRFTLKQMGRGRFNLDLWFGKTQKQPYGTASHDPYDTDISDILERIRGPVTPYPPRDRRF